MQQLHVLISKFPFPLGGSTLETAEKVRFKIGPKKGKLLVWKSHLIILI